MSAASDPGILAAGAPGNGGAAVGAGGGAEPDGIGPKAHERFQALANENKALREARDVDRLEQAQLRDRLARMEGGFEALKRREQEEEPEFDSPTEEEIYRLRRHTAAVEETAKKAMRAVEEVRQERQREDAQHRFERLLSASVGGLDFGGEGQTNTAREGVEGWAIAHPQATLAEVRAYAVRLKEFMNPTRRDAAPPAGQDPKDYAEQKRRDAEALRRPASADSLAPTATPPKARNPMESRDNARKAMLADLGVK